MPDDALEELAASYALGSLEDDGERADYALHVRVCRLCMRLTSEFSASAGVLDESLEQPGASPALRERILESTYASEAGEEQEIVPGARPEARSGWPGRALTFASLAAAAAVIAVIALAAWNISLQGRLDDRQQQVDNWQAMGEAIASGAQRIDLQGTQSAPGAYASLFKDPDSDAAYMVFRGLTQPEGDDVFQLWVITGETPQSAGLISPSAVESGPVMVQVQIEGADAVGVSTEPPGGSDRPTGPIVLLGQIS